MTEKNKTREGRTEVPLHPIIPAFILSLLGGILILIAGGMFSMMAFMGGSYFGMMNFFGGMMGGYMGMMGSVGVPLMFMPGFGLASIVAGVIVLVGAGMLWTRPTEHRAWGIVIIVFSLASYVGMGGFWVGGVIGLAGGIVALNAALNDRAGLTG